tara:strand:+ start:1826 stop:2437 length:612 start_codon:yes stop_codon:yes gene_type:complete
MIKLVIFDLDGVLVDACEWHRVALNKALKQVCDYEISEEAHHNTFNGIPTKVKLNKLTEMDVLSASSHEEIYNLKQQMTIETINENAHFRSEKVDMVQYLKNKGCHVACFTNSIRETATLMLSKTGVLEYLDCLITNEDVENSKPNPEGYNFLVDKFNVKRENVIIVEDSPKGLAAAYASGCNVVEVKNPDYVTKMIFEEHFE